LFSPHSSSSSSSSFFVLSFVVVSHVPSEENLRLLHVREIDISATHEFLLHLLHVLGGLLYNHYISQVGVKDAEILESLIDYLGWKDFVR
jgi:hypothetical protein